MWEHARGGFGNLRKLKIVIAGVLGVFIQVAHTFHPIAMKLSQVVNMPAVVLKIKEKLKVYKPEYPVLPFTYRSTHRSSDCHETFTSYWKHIRSRFGNLKN